METQTDGDAVAPSLEPLSKAEVTFRTAKDETEKLHLRARNEQMELELKHLRQQSAQQADDLHEMAGLKMQLEKALKASAEDFAINKVLWAKCTRNGLVKELTSAMKTSGHTVATVAAVSEPRPPAEVQGAKEESGQLSSSSVIKIESPTKRSEMSGSSPASKTRSTLAPHAMRTDHDQDHHGDDVEAVSDADVD